MRLVVVLLALILAVVFAVQNATMVTLTVFAWQLNASLAVIIVLCFAIGAIAASVALLPGVYRERNKARRLQSELAALRLSHASATPEVVSPDEHQLEPAAAPVHATRLSSPHTHL